jgi:hypothetical protein
MGFCNDITPTCDVCFVVDYGVCNDVLLLSLNLAPSTTYYLDLIDKFDIIAQTSVATDANGEFNLTQTWTQYFGAIELQIFSDADRLNRVAFVKDGTEYDCVILQGGVAGIAFCSNELDFSELCNSQYLIL